MPGQQVTLESWILEPLLAQAIKPLEAWALQDLAMLSEGQAVEIPKSLWPAWDALSLYHSPTANDLPA